MDGRHVGPLVKLMGVLEPKEYLVDPCHYGVSQHFHLLIAFNYVDGVVDRVLLSIYFLKFNVEGQTLRWDGMNGTLWVDVVERDPREQFLVSDDHVP